MMVMIDNEVWNGFIQAIQTIENSPRLAAEWCQRLGELAPWWLTARALEQAAEYTGQRFYHHRAPGLGCCSVLIVSTSRFQHTVALPLQWRANTTDDPGLPPDLRRVADEVRDHLKTQPPEWGLHLDVSHADLSGLSKLSADSGWAPLAIGLSLAKLRIRSNPRTWVTGAWNPHVGGLEQVDDIEAKLQRAIEIGADSFIVPPANANRARQLASMSRPAPEVVVLNSSQQLEAAFKPALVHAGVPPALHDPLDDRLAYLNLILDRSQRNKYYAQFLSSTLAIQVRERSRHPETPTPNRFDFLVTVGSANTDHIMLASQTHQVREVLILHTQEYREQCYQAAQWLGDFQIQAVLKAFAKRPSYVDTYNEIKTRLEPWLGRVREPDQLVFDLTPGQRPMAAALEDLAPVGSWLIYLHHHYDQQNRPRPGEDHYECWRKTAERRFPSLKLDGFDS